MKKNHIQATTIRPILIIAVFLSIFLMFGGFCLAQDYLKTLANNIMGNNSSESSSFQTDQQIKSDISENQTTVNKLDKFVASSQDYQNQAIIDLNTYASATGISISGQSTTPAPETESLATLSNGIQANYIQVELNNPVKYSSLLKFISAIETNLPKMQLTGINITPDSADKSYVSVEPLIIKVYTK